MTTLLIVYLVVTVFTAACHASWWNMTREWGEDNAARHHALSVLMSPLWPYLAFRAAQQIREDARK